MTYIFIHGLGQTPTRWKKTISYMEKTNDYVCPDLFGILKGKSATYENLYDAFSKQCEIYSNPFHLCGLSLGAVLALHYTISHPKKVKSLVLIAGQYDMPKKLLTFQNFIYHLMPKTVFRTIGLEKKDLIALTHSMKEICLTERLDNIICPTMILCGQKDWVNRRASESLAKKIKTAQFHLVENAGHEVNEEAPELLAGILESFYTTNA